MPVRRPGDLAQVPYNERFSRYPLRRSSPMLATTAPGLVDELRQIVGLDGVLSAHSDLIVYECDGFVIEKNSPDVVVFPKTAEQVAAIVRLCNGADVPIVPRGAGTSLS